MSRLPTTPGWYNDPDGVYEHQAHWDGENWTGETRPQPAPLGFLWGEGVIAVVAGGGLFLWGLWALLSGEGGLWMILVGLVIGVFGLAFTGR